MFLHDFNKFDGILIVALKKKDQNGVCKSGNDTSV